MADESSLARAPLAERRAGTALLSMQLRSAQQLAAEAESTAIDRAAARAELRARLATLVQRRRHDLDELLATVRNEAASAVSAAEQEARVIVEAAKLMAQASLTQRVDTEVPVFPEAAPDPVEPATTEVSAANALPPRAGIALLTMQLRVAEQLAREADEAEAAARLEHDAHLLQRQQAEQRRDALDAELRRAEADAANLIAAAHAEAEALRAEPRPSTPAEPSSTEVTALPLALTDHAIPLSSPPAAVPINVVIDAEAFARVFAAAFSSLVDERLANAGTMHSQPMYPPMYAQLPVPPQVVKQSFWSHAKHIDVLLLSGAMVIVLVVLAAWLV